jgi:cysteine dioxygenase
MEVMSLQTTSETAPDWAKSLIESIRSIDAVLTLDQALSALRSISVLPSEVIASTRFDAEFYTRTSILCTPHVEVLIMGWLPGQMSPPHNHKGSICAVDVLVGNALEVAYERSNSGALVPKDLSRLSVGSVAISEDEEIHQFGNGSEVPMVSLHVYSPPLHAAEIFSESESILSGNVIVSMAPDQPVSVKVIDLPLLV